MPVTEYEMFQEHQRAGWVRLRTLVILRWVAVAGQIAAVIVAVFFFGLQVEVGLTATIIGASVLANLLVTFLNPEIKRLSEREAALMLVFDVVQLGLLLYLTGGLNNPFALLMIAPATIAATLLYLRSAVLLAVLTIVIISLTARWHVPILTAEGQVLELPRLFLFGFWIALVIGIVFVAIYARQVTEEMHTMSEALVATQLALAREQKLTDLGGVVAAYAHELGTPLATIKLVSSEMIDELEGHPELAEDAALIRSQADRCRDILRSMGRAGKDDLQIHRAPFESVAREAAEPHLDRGKKVDFRLTPPDTDPRQPNILRRPEIIHGLRNLIQNATDFAATRVEVELSWTADQIEVRITDDGPGFPPAVIPRIGDPFVRRRRSDDRSRPGYEGMGLGLFIAKTLLERSGARLTFANGRPSDRDGYGGAIVVVNWPRQRVEPAAEASADGLGANIPFIA